jgi:glycosyltransferase involved in cell wall biosynthesis/SAM-dependent methyltransferase
LPAETIAEKAATMSDFIIANSNVTRTQCGDPERSSVLYNTVDSPELNLAVRERDGQLRVAMVSSNIPKKGLDDFFAIARRAYERSDPLSFWLVGPDNDWVKKHVEEPNACPPNVHRAGYVERPEEILREVDVIVNLSTFAESFGRSVAEGMLARRPAVVYERGALPELIRDGIDGFVVPFRDVDQALERLNRLAQEPALVAKMGESAHQRAKTMFSRDAGAQTLKQIYDQVLSSSSTSLAKAEPVIEKKTVVSTRKMRIGYFQWHFPVPSETFVLNELRHFLSLGHDVRVFCRQSPFKDFKPDFPVQWQQVQSPDELAAAISDTNREIMHSHFVYPTVTEFLWPACEKAGVPFTFIAHAQDIFRHENIARNRLGEIGHSPVCHRVFAPGRFHRQFFIESGIPKEKIIVNPQPIPADAYEPQVITPRLLQPRMRMCAIHRFVEKKALHNAIRAVGQLSSLGISLSIYGYGPLEQSYRDLVAELRLDNVFFPGPVRDREHMTEVFRENDLFLCPSIRAEDGDMDGIPTILLEAMASHVPVLASRISSIPDLVLDGVTGYLCEPGDVDSLMQTILRFYNDETSHIRAIVENARELVVARYNVVNANRTLLRTWSKEGLDIVLVTFNETARIKDVIERIYRFTKTPFNLYIVDNGSEQDTLDYLRSVEAGRDNVRVLLQKENLFVGPGTNKGVEAGRAAVAVYLCGREAYILSEGWDQRILDYMEDNPEVGLAGTLGYSPSYFTGAEYLEKLEPFPKFRNPQFAENHPDRLFQHVQGGIMVLRRSMFESIGGFSETVPHNHTDVEYSYYVESCGWKLGHIPGVVSLYHKTRPELSARISETLFVAHPASPTLAPLLDAVVDLKTNFCNVCGTAAPFDSGLVCGNCSSTGFDRSLYRFLAESNLTYRKLRGLLVGSATALVSTWKTMFQGMVLSYADFVSQSEQEKGLKYASASLDVIVIRTPDDLSDACRAALSECARILKPGGSILYHQPYGRTPLLGAPQPDKFFDPDSVASLLETQGLRVKARIRYASAAVRYSDHIIFHCEKNS